MAKPRVRVSPLKDPPLNVPGQSGDDELQDFLLDHFLLPLFGVLGLFLFSIWEWFAASRHIPRQPVIALAVAFVALIIVAIYWRFRWSELQRRKLGRDGERAVGQFLESHVEPDSTVYHDVPSDWGNIDHVVICSRGIFAIETKTRSKSAQSKVVVTDGDKLLADGYPMERDPIAQAKACADNLRNILKDSTGKTFGVRPVVVFPGWYVEDKRKSRSAWVLEPKQLPGWVKQEAVTIAESDVSLASYHLSRYIRTYAKARSRTAK